jgi:hypothetical protein
LPKPVGSMITPQFRRLMGLESDDGRLPKCANRSHLPHRGREE